MRLTPSVLCALWPPSLALFGALTLAPPAAAQSAPGAAPSVPLAAPSTPATPSTPGAAPSTTTAAPPPLAPSADAATAAGAPPAAPPPDAGAILGSPQRPLVDVRGDQGTLEVRANPRGPEGRTPFEDDDDEGWRPLCALPCRRALDASLEYRVAGPGVVATDAFRLPVGRANVQIDVETGSRGSRVTGIVFIPVGATALGGGLLVAAIGGAFEQDDTLRGGLITAAAGAFLMTAGIMLVRSNRTSVRSDAPGEPSLRLASGLALTPRGLTF